MAAESILELINTNIVTYGDESNKLLAACLFTLSACFGVLLINNIFKR